MKNVPDFTSPTADKLPPWVIAKLVTLRTEIKWLRAVHYALFLLWILLAFLTLPVSIWLIIPAIACLMLSLVSWVAIRVCHARIYRLMLYPHPVLRSFWDKRALRKSRDYLIQNCTEQTLIRLSLQKLVDPTAGTAPSPPVLPPEALLWFVRRRALVKWLFISGLLILLLWMLLNVINNTLDLNLYLPGLLRYWGYWGYLGLFMVGGILSQGLYNRIYGNRATRYITFALACIIPFFPIFYIIDFINHTRIYLRQHFTEQALREAGFLRQIHQE